MLRRLRGVLGIAATWGAAFAGVGALFGLALVLGIASGILPPSRNGQDGLYAAIVLSRVARWGTIGVLSGLAFAGIVAVAERRQTVATLSERRFARLGLLAGSLGATAMAAVVVAFILHDGVRAAQAWGLVAGLAGASVVGGVLGSATAAATLRAARRERPAVPNEP